MFNECHVKDYVYELCFCEGMKMILRFKKKIVGKLLDLIMLEKKRFCIYIQESFQKENLIES